jgi:hypothetical protein
MNKTTFKVVNITPATYAKVSMIAKANGRPLGEQVKVWADKEMTKCGHVKHPVTIQTYPQVEIGQIDIRYRTAWYCPRCKRVYAEA